LDLKRKLPIAQQLNFFSPSRSHRKPKTSLLWVMMAAYNDRLVGGTSGFAIDLSLRVLLPRSNCDEDIIENNKQRNSGADASEGEQRVVVNAAKGSTILTTVKKTRLS
jgi:hypothetical protein